MDWPDKRAEVFIWTIPARFTGMNLRNLFTCLITVKVTHGVTGEFSCFGSKRRFNLVLASTEWYFKTKDAKIIL